MRELRRAGLQRHLHASPAVSASAAEVNQLIDAIKQEANASYNGQYIFSGTATSTAPYQSGANDAYAGDTGTSPG